MHNQSLMSIYSPVPIFEQHCYFNFPFFFHSSIADQWPMVLETPQIRIHEFWGDTKSQSRFSGCMDFVRRRGGLNIPVQLDEIGWPATSKLRYTHTSHVPWRTDQCQKCESLIQKWCRARDEAFTFVDYANISSLPYHISERFFRRYCQSNSQMEL